MQKNDYCTIYIVRHGQTEWNVERRLQGHGDSPLTELGIKQAHDLKELLGNVHFDAVFSSDLLRAKRTAEIITLEKKLEVLTTELLRERSWGKFEGQNVEVLHQFDELFEKLTDAEKFTYKSDVSIENDAEISTRFITFTREIAIRYARKTVLIVTHGGIMRALLIKTGFGTYQSLHHGAVKNTSYIKIETDGIDFFLKDTHNIDFKKA